jgi:hypothetical protein
VKHDLGTEATIFGRYITKQIPSESVCTIYRKAMRANPGTSSAADTRLLAFIYRHPHAIGIIDAGLALVSPQSEIRRRLYVMFSILESTPEHHALFLPKRHSVGGVLFVGFSGLRAVCKAVAGVFMVKVVGR